MKAWLKSVARAAGYDIRRRENAAFPYVRGMEFCGQRFDFWIADACGRLWYEEVRQHMEREAEQLKQMARPGERVLEMGCHHGFFTVLLAQAVGEGGFVCAVEASPENALIAQAQITLNSLGARATVLHAAGSDGAGSLKVNAGNEGGNNRIVTGDGVAALEVRAVTGDELDAKYGPFTMLKLDVEGFEAKVLKGCRGILERRPRIAIEVHCADLAGYGSSVKEVLELLHIADYEGFMVQRPAYTVEPLAVEKIAGWEPVNLFLVPR